MLNLVLRASPWEVVVILLLGAGVAVSVFFTQRPRRGALSSLAFWFKLSAILLLCFLLLKPEVRKELPQSAEKSLLVLWDETPSMKTEDVPEEGSEISRATAVQEFLASDAWADFKEKGGFSIEERSFGKEEKRTDLSAALEAGKGKRAVLLLSDGAWNVGASPVERAQELRKERVPVFSVSIGEESALPDLKLEEVEAPLLTEVQEAFSVSSQIVSSFSTLQEARVVLSSGEEVIEEKSVELVPQQPLTVSFNLELSTEGRQDLSLEVSPLEGESNRENNVREFSITARKQVLKVLLVDTLPRWEYRYIRNAMMRDPQVEVSCLLLHPELPPAQGAGYLNSFPDDLSAYDVIFLGDIGIRERQLTPENAAEISRAVKKNASGLMLLPGRQGWQKSLYAQEEFHTLYPVEGIKEFGGVEGGHSAGLKLSAAGKNSLLLSLDAEKWVNESIWENLPGFTWYQPVSDLKVGATALAYHDTERNEKGRIPLIVTGKAGRGKVLWMGVDSSWKWRKGVEDLYHYRFWRQLARWMAYQRSLTHSEQARIFLSKETPPEGSTLMFSLHAMTSEGKPALEKDVKLTLRSEDGEETLVALIPTKNWGEYQGRIQMKKSGLATLTVEVEGKVVGEREIPVSPLLQEGQGDPAELSTLHEIARITRAVSVPYSQRADIFPHLTQAATPPPRYEFFSLYKHWSWYFLLVACLSLSWIFRQFSNAN